MKLPRINVSRTHLTVATYLFVIVGLFVGGMVFERTRQPLMIPANQQCQEYAVAVKAQLDADMQVVFGRERPKAPDAEHVDRLADDCSENLERYELKIEAIR